MRAASEPAVKTAGYYRVAPAGHVHMATAFAHADVGSGIIDVSPLAMTGGTFRVTRRLASTLALPDFALCGIRYAPSAWRTRSDD